VSHVFISYKREDIDRVAPLVQALRGAGIDLWWDQDIPPGGSWRETIVEKLDSAALCIVVWSPHSAGAGGRFVREEAERAARRTAYLGVLIDNVAPPFGFGEWQAIDLSGWGGDPQDPQLRHFVETVRAHLAGRPAPVADVPRQAAPARRRAGRSRKPLLIAAAAAALLALAGLAYFLLAGRGTSQTPTAFVSERLAAANCTWAGIGEVNTLPDGEHISLKGIAAAPEEVQASLLREASAASVPLAGVEVRELAVAPSEICAELSMLKPYRAPGNARRLTIVPPRGALTRSGGALEGWFEWEINWAGLPQHAALLGLDSQGGVEVLIPDLQAYRRATKPERQNGDVAAYQAGFSDEGTGVRNVGLILMTANAPIDAALVNAIGTEGTTAFIQRVDQAAKAGNWQFELGLVRCGFEGREGQTC
jgi:hypothetical protein